MSSTKQDGKCKFGRKCKFSHDPTTACSLFLSRKNCPKGADCYFAHSQQPHSSSTQTPRPLQKTRVTPATLDPDYEARFRKWTFLIPRNNHHSPNITTFFDIGWDLLASSDTSGQQRLIKKLASEEGLNMIKTLVETVDDAQEDDEALSLFTGSVVPFLQILTYRNVASSLILEHPLDTIYNFLYGPGGRRGAMVFRFTARALSLAVVTSDNDIKRISSLNPCVAALQRLIDLNQGAQLQQEFLPIVETMSACVEPDNILPESRRCLDKIRLRLGLGSLIPSAAKAKPSPTGKAYFAISYDLPGELSANGPRHDNDHEDIDDIQILPTAEEINSTRLEYLPFNNTLNGHLTGLPALLDRQFRLLREDAIGGLRDAVRRETERLTKGSLAAVRSISNTERTYVHEDLRLQRWEVDRRKGIQLVVDFEQPLHIAQKGETARKDWWESSRRLQPTSLVCIVTSLGQTIFCLVCDPEPTAPVKRRHPPRNEHEAQAAAAEEKAAEAEFQRRKIEMPSLHKQNNRAAVMLTIVETTWQHVAWISRHLVKSRSLTRMSLVEFPGVLLPSFQPTLKALQSMSKSLDLPFTEYLAPEVLQEGIVEVAPPLYTQQRSFAFDLGPIAKGSPLKLSTNQPFDRAVFNSNTTLDRAQQSAVLHALTNSLALIQGPPGTGKSYTGVSIIKALLHNREAGKIGPIICVCYTNHALDQLLEHLVEDGIKQVVRIGGRSKSELLKNINLRDLAQEIQLTRDEGQEKYQLYQQLNSSIDEIEGLLKGLNALGSEESLKSYLMQTWPSHHKQLFESVELEDGFKLVTYEKDVVGRWLQGAMSTVTRDLPASALHQMALNEMSATERQRVYSGWIEERANQLAMELDNALEPYTETRVELDKYYQEQQRRALSEAYIVGVTTSGLAKNLDVLRRLRSKVMVCEEAGEVLEAHTLTALLPSVEHAILIGDHQQLRPQVKDYHLCHDNPRGKHLALDISLFERLVSPAHDTKLPPLPFSRLKIQRRMHPSIAELIRRTLYVDLEDDATVCEYPAVDGMRDRLFWLTHNNREDGADPTQAQSDSKSNSFEVSMVSALASHLVRQGTYAAEDIAILTPYVRQLQNLRRSLGGMFEVVMSDRDIEALEEQETFKDARPAPPPSTVRKITLANALRIATVDNFQGEEAKIIILSFVRSNAEGKCGFLKTSNRINVALSRARHGMYIIGDPRTASSVPMWAEIIGLLEAQGNIGPTLSLCCPRHSEDLIEVSTPDEFAILSPEGGSKLYIELFVASNGANGANLAVTTHAPSPAVIPVIPNAKSSMANAILLAADLSAHATTAARLLVMVQSPAHYAANLAKSNASIPTATDAATSLVYLARRDVHRRAHTDIVKCLVRFPVIESHVLCDAPSVSCAAISAHPMVDYYEALTYAEIDLDEDPCIFPTCGHVITRANLDQHMEMKEYYRYGLDGAGREVITAAKVTSAPLSVTVQKTCPACRAPIQNIHRYGRIARRAWIDEATKKFIVWANSSFVPMAARMTEVEGQFQSDVAGAGDRELQKRLKVHVVAPLSLEGSIDSQVRKIYNLTKSSKRYKDAFRLHTRIDDFLSRVDEREQPFSRIYDLVQDAKRHRGVEGSMVWTPGVLQTRNRLLATVLLIRCEYTIVANFLMTSKGTGAQIKVDFKKHQDACESLIEDSKFRKQPSIQVEGHLYWARFLCLQRGASEAVPDGSPALLSAREHLQTARDICHMHPGQTAGIISEVEDVEKALRDSTFYTSVTNEEKAAVYAAMASDFRGTGHWYYCENGHPFTVGECGMPMQTSRCPQCGAAVGGERHHAVEGVRRAADMDEQFGRLHV
ncbi:MAG: hypothetical protein LQ339_001864 [Xanthoria mediterranea]|nr:MAG: hypothetical protein LQ339_001864 [Xanthoria mediterranea]